MRAFCQENGIAEDRYYYWQRRLRSAVGEELCARQGTLPAVSPYEGPAFAELPSAMARPQSAPVRMETGGITVEISTGADAGLAEAILRLLLGRC